MAINWVFVDLISWDYDVATPLARPLGGSQSALCYLATELSRRGDTVTTLTGISNPTTVGSVRCLRFNDFPADVFAPANTVAVVLNGPADVAPMIRQALPAGRPLVLWTQHAYDQPAMQPLRNPPTAGQWDRIVCISDWQLSTYHQWLGVQSEKMLVMRNAISPAFENLFRDAAELYRAKSRRLRLAYTSTPFRGLDVLLACFPAIHNRHPTCELDVFSSMAVYSQTGDADNYQPLYEQCRATEGIHYRGSVSQLELAQELTGASVLAYPNTFAETSCIAVMEALASGLLVVSSDLGALPETCSGFARLVPPIAPNRTQEAFAIDFARSVDQALFEVKVDPPRFYADRFAQSQAINASCTWVARASQWQQAAADWLSSSTAP